MIKFILPRAILAALGASCLCALSASAQSSSATTNAPTTTQVTPGATAPADAPAKIGPAPAHSKQDKVLTSALSSQTRQTLQEAMNAMFDDEKPHRSAK